MVSILIVASGKKVMALLRRCNSLKLFNSYFKWAIGMGIVTAIISVIFLGVLDKINRCPQYWFYIWIVSVAMFVGTAARVLYIMLQILASIVEEDK